MPHKQVQILHKVCKTTYHCKNRHSHCGEDIAQRNKKKLVSDGSDAAVAVLQRSVNKTEKKRICNYLPLFTG